MAKTNPGTLGLEGWWQLDEASGNAIDATENGHTLTETHGTIASTDGGREFVLADEEYFVEADTAGLSFGDEAFTIGCWLSLGSTGTYMGILSKWDDGLKEYLLYLDDVTNKLVFYVSYDGTNSSNVSSDNYGGIPLDTKIFVVAWHDPEANKIYIQINNGTTDEGAHTTGCNNNTSNFVLGSRTTLTTPIQFYDGIMWSAFVARRTFTADEREWFYNSGTPRTYAELAEDQLKTKAIWWI